MPSYTFYCNKCQKSYEVFRTISQYQEHENCVVCGCLDTFRDYKSDSTSGFVKCRTIGALAERNTSKMSEDEKQSLNKKHNSYRKLPNKALPPGMKYGRKNDE